MKPVILNKKLILNKLTISHLSNVRGGNVDYRTCYSDCMDVKTCDTCETWCVEVPTCDTCIRSWCTAC